MAQFHEDPAQLTKEKLKSELMAHNVPLPSADSKKDAYVQLYLKNLTVLNKKISPHPDTFSSDEEATAPLLSGRSRSGKKATRKSVRSEEKDVSGLTDEELKVQLLKYGIHSGPVVGSTRKLYEKKLQQFLDQPPVETTLPEPETTIPEAVTIKPDGNQNGNTHSSEDQYSDKEDEVDPIPEPVPIATKTVRSRGKTPVTTRTSSRQRARVEEAAGVQKTSVDGGDVLKEMFPNEPATPTGISATCRKPIHGAAGRPVKPLNLWSEEPLLQQSVYTATKSSVTDVRSAALAPRPRPRRWFLFWLKVLLMLTLAVSLYYVFKNVTAEQISACRMFVQDNVITPVINYISRESHADAGK